jgi:hypothetical protein
MKHRKLSIVLFILFIIANTSIFAQTTPFNIYIEPLNIPNLGGIQSYAYGQHNGKWLIVGGRLDGLHQRQPFASFDIAGHNNQIIVVDPVAMQKWSVSNSSLPVALREQLSSTNMGISSGRKLFILCWWIRLQCNCCRSYNLSKFSSH